MATFVTLEKEIAAHHFSIVGCSDFSHVSLPYAAVIAALLYDLVPIVI